MSWDVIYHQERNGAVPADDFLKGCPTKVRARLLATLDAVAEAPPPQFSGGGQWEAMHGSMGGFYEVRASGPGREQFRLYCILENADEAELRRRGLPRPAIAVLTGLRKQWMTKFSEADYQRVRAIGEEYRGTYPRRVAT